LNNIRIEFGAQQFILGARAEPVQALDITLKGQVGNDSCCYWPDQR
jgi:hypothetical protein